MSGDELLLQSMVTVYNLKQQIKAENSLNSLGTVDSDANKLTLWKVSIPYDDNLNATLKTVQLDDSHGCVKMGAIWGLSKYFSAGLVNESIHVLVHVPPDSEWQEILWSIVLTPHSIEKVVKLAAQGYRRNIQIPCVYFICSQPCAGLTSETDTTYSRPDTVQALYAQAKAESFVHVCIKQPIMLADY